MHALDRLSELHLVAEQHDVARRRAHRDQVRERYLSGFVDEQVVDARLEGRVREQPRRARDQRTRRSDDVRIFVNVADEPATDTALSGSSFVDFLVPENV